MYQRPEKRVNIISYVLNLDKGFKPSSTIAKEIDGETIERHAQGDGQYDAFINALKKYLEGRTGHSLN